MSLRRFVSVRNPSCIKRQNSARRESSIVLIVINKTFIVRIYERN